MQRVSKEYKQMMKSPLRGRAYINVTIGVINQEAQKTALAPDSGNSFTYFSNREKPFRNYPVEVFYATAEEGFARIDENAVFLPKREEEVAFNNGIVTKELSGSVYICFGTKHLDIKGLTIDFGHCYPVDFTIENDMGIKTYSGNEAQRWSTEDVFYDTSFLKISPVKMVKGQNRLRIYEFLCGAGNVFTNDNVKNYSMKDYISPIAETIPSKDMSLTAYNYDLRYCVDNPESPINFMEIGQKINVSFGYDISGNGDIEWVDSQETYLKSWTANDTEVKFTATDQFDNLSGTYYRGLYREAGITAYDLGIDILQDMGVEENRYYLDPYLKSVLIRNPMPPVKHTEALQLLANACRCTLSQDRREQILLRSSFVPQMEVSADAETEFSHAENLLLKGEKEAYGVSSAGFAAIETGIFFLPRNNNEYSKDTGFISAETADESGNFETNPILTIELEAGYSCFGLLIDFRSTAPEKFQIITYYDNVVADEIQVDAPELNCVIDKEFDRFDKMEIIFTKAKPNSRISVDQIGFGDVTDYTLSYDYDLLGTPVGKRQTKLKSLSVVRTSYNKSGKEAEQITQEEILISGENSRHVMYFNNASYDMEALFEVTSTDEDGNEVTEYVSELPSGERVAITESSNYFAVLEFSNVSAEKLVSVVVMGKEYTVTEHEYTKQHSFRGEEKRWHNPLIGSIKQAAELEKWLSDYYNADLEYELSYRGDPRVDANDLFHLELRERDTALVRGYENTLNYAGAWKGKMKVRKVVE